MRRDRPADGSTGRTDEFGGPAVRGDDVLGDDDVGLGQRPRLDLLIALLAREDHREDVGLVDREHVRRRVQQRQHGLGEPGEALDGCRIPPPAVIREPPGRREVVDSDRRLHTEFVAAVDDATIVIERRARDHAFSGLDARPLEREAIGVQPRRGERCDVFAVAVVAVGGIPRRFRDVGAGSDFARPPVAVDVAPLDLVPGGRRAPEESVGEGQLGQVSGSLSELI